MRCPRCQQNNDGSADKCIYCGAVLSESVLVTGLPMDKRPAGSGSPQTTNESLSPLLGDLLKENPTVSPSPSRPTKSNSKSGIGIDDLLQNSRLASWESLERTERAAIPGKLDDIRQKRQGNLPEWIYEVNYQNLPKKPGYVVYADENGISFVTKCANPIRQLIALAIDAGVIAGLSIGAFIVATNYFLTDRNASIKADTGTFIIITAIVTILYFFLFKSRSAGNRIMQLKVILADGTKPAFQPAITKGVYYAAIIASLLLLNYLPFVFVIPIPIILGVLYLTVFLPSDFRAVPDRIIGAYSVELDTMLVHGRDF
jgi:hypothetical protein